MTTIIETLLPENFVACGQCESNARYNEAGGYIHGAQSCRAYCRDGHKTGAASAASLLVRAGAQFVEKALAENPEGPVSMVTTLERTEVIYDVVIGDIDAGDHGYARTIWRSRVVFGQTDRTVAGGGAFVDAARTQNEVAQAVFTLLRRPAKPDDRPCPPGLFCVHEVKCPGAV